MRAGVNIRELQGQIFHQHHPQILPLGRTGAGDMKCEILIRQALVGLARIFLGEAVPVGVAAGQRFLVRDVELVGDGR
jgi:hypothetical protein